MKKVTFGFTMLMTLVILAGCAGNNGLIKAMSASTSQSVFQEIEENLPPARGYVDLRIYSSLKTHKPGIYSSKDIHGTKDFMLLLNIDGQATTLNGRMSEEKSEAQQMGDPEEGEGIRYQFAKKIRVKAGAHRVIVALPAYDLVAEREVVFSEGENNSLTVEPIYGSIPGKQRPGTYGLTSFKEGISQFVYLFNGKTM
jgi:hypothetical protein